MVALVLEGLYRFVLTVVVCAAAPALGKCFCCDCCDCNGDADTALLQRFLVVLMVLDMCTPV
jgi:hypothetical protein